MEKAIKLVSEQVGGFGVPESNVRDILKQAFIGWYSRSVATCLFVFCKNEDGSWCVLASERGEEAADFQGYWNCPCGYLDFDETAAACARRECYEETGVELDINNIHFISFEDDPVTANRQNVTFRFYTFIYDKNTTDFKFSKENNEGKEVGRIQWIPVEEIHNYKWAFNHEKRIDEIFNTVYANSEGYRFWKKLCKKWNDFWTL
jgi:8-oxo-dGTP pyrophosphatase MutT (NUDIX family)